MSYVTQAGLEARFGVAEIAQISDLSGQAVADAARIAKIIADVQSRIDSYLQSRYALPLSVVPAAIEQVAADMARYLLMDTRPTETVAERYKDAIRWLERVAAGTLALGLDPAGTSQVGDSGGAAVSITGPGRVFTGDSLADYARPSRVWP